MSSHHAENVEHVIDADGNVLHFHEGVEQSHGHSWHEHEIVELKDGKRIVTHKRIPFGDPGYTGIDAPPERIARAVTRGGAKPRPEPKRREDDGG